MIDESLCKKVLTIGNRSDVPDGGISQVLYSYRKYIFSDFQSIVNYKRGSFIYKLCLMAGSLIQTFFTLLFHRDIRIVHVHSASDNGFRRNVCYINLAHFMGRKVILHMHSGRFNDYYEKNKREVNNVLAKCECVIALTNKIKSFYEKLGCTNVAVINNVIEYPVFKDIRFDDDAIHLLFLGVITKTKGIYDLLDVILEHKNEFLHKLVLHVGGNKEVDALKRMISTNGLEDIVKFEGWIRGEKKIEFLNACKVFILPSYTEGLPISVLEAQSYGDFIIATKVGGIPEIVNETNGILFNPGDKQALYAILSNLIQAKSTVGNPEVIKKSAETYLPAFVEKQLESLYRRLL